MKELLILLAPFKMATDVFQLEYETIGFVIPAYVDMINRCTVDRSINTAATSIVSCTKVASALRDSTITRLGYVLNDKFYMLGNMLIILRN